jgi:probable rRNA maturation factor
MRVLIRNQQRQRRLNRARILKAARRILSLLEQQSVELSILLVGDRKMLRLNHQYRGIKRSTDVLSFDADIPVRVDGIKVLGDIVINISRVDEQARLQGIGFYDELDRLLVHGILHLLGYDHEASRYRAMKMRRKEEEILDALKKVH